MEILLPSGFALAKKTRAGPRLVRQTTHNATRGPTPSNHGYVGSSWCVLGLKHGLEPATFLADPFFKNPQSHPLMTPIASSLQLAFRYATNGNTQIR